MFPSASLVVYKVALMGVKMLRVLGWKELCRLMGMFLYYFTSYHSDHNDPSYSRTPVMLPKALKGLGVLTREKTKT